MLDIDKQAISELKRLAREDENSRQVVARITSGSDKLRLENLRLQAEVEALKKKLGLSLKRLYGSSSESKVPGQEVLFNEAEVEADPNAPEPVAAVSGAVSDHKRKKRSLQGELSLSTLKIDETVHDLPYEKQGCPTCFGALHKIGEDDSIEIEIIPAQVKIVKHIRPKYSCRNCQREHNTPPVVSAPIPPSAFPGSLASPSAVAYIMHQKYVMGSPLYRQEVEMDRMGLPISRQTMANWVIAGAGLLERVYYKMWEMLVQEEILHADETRIQVLHEPGRAPQTDSFMWLYRTGRYSHPIVLYDYQPTRGREHPAKFLEKFKGVLMVDGYAGYEKLNGITLAGCWAHARRKYVEGIALLPPERQKAGGTKLHEGLAYCDALFEIERELHDLPPNQRHSERQHRSQPVLTAYRAWLDAAAITAVPKSPLADAVAYSVRQWSKLTTFMTDGRVELDNNSAERAIKPFATGRKNWLFANSTVGADASATVYSIVESAKANGLDPMKYLQFLFEQIPTVTGLTGSSIEDLLPWSNAAQSTCKLPQ